jgi:hypothetical protein
MLTKDEQPKEETSTKDEHPGVANGADKILNSIPFDSDQLPGNNSKALQVSQGNRSAITDGLDQQ